MFRSPKKAKKMQTIEFKSTTIIKHHSIHISGEIEFNLICRRDGSDSGVSADHRQNPPETKDAVPEPVSSEETSAPQPETAAPSEAESEEPQTEASTAPDNEARDPEGGEGEEGEDSSGCEKSSGNSI